MEFKNITEEAVKVRLDEGDNEDKATSECKWKWATIAPGEVVNISLEYGNKLGFQNIEPKEEVEYIASVEVEPEEEVIITTPEDTTDSDYLSELLDVSGIGPKTAKDIISAYPTKTDLKTALTTKEHISLRDDIVKKLVKIFG